MFKFNISHLNDTVMLNVLKACRSALSDGRGYVSNRKGHNILIIDKMFSLEKRCTVFVVKTTKGDNVDNVLLKKYGKALSFLSERLL